MNLKRITVLALVLLFSVNETASNVFAMDPVLSPFLGSSNIEQASTLSDLNASRVENPIKVKNTPCEKNQEVETNDKPNIENIQAETSEPLFDLDPSGLENPGELNPAGEKQEDKTKDKPNAEEIKAEADDKPDEKKQKVEINDNPTTENQVNLKDIFEKILNNKQLDSRYFAQQSAFEKALELFAKEEPYKTLIPEEYAKIIEEFSYTDFYKVKNAESNFESQFENIRTQLNKINRSVCALEADFSPCKIRLNDNKKILNSSLKNNTSEIEYREKFNNSINVYCKNYFKACKMQKALKENYDNIISLQTEVENLKKNKDEIYKQLCSEYPENKGKTYSNIATIIKTQGEKYNLQAAELLHLLSQAKATVLALTRSVSSTVAESEKLLRDNYSILVAYSHMKESVQFEKELERLRNYLEAHETHALSLQKQNKELRQSNEELNLLLQELQELKQQNEALKKSNEELKSAMQDQSKQSNELCEAHTLLLQDLINTLTNTNNDNDISTENIPQNKIMPIQKKDSGSISTISGSHPNTSASPIANCIGWTNIQNESLVQKKISELFKDGGFARHVYKTHCYNAAKPFHSDYKLDRLNVNSIENTHSISSIEFKNNIESFAGIEYYLNLESLCLQSDSSCTIDLSKNGGLLDLHANSKLQQLSCISCGINTIILPKSEALITINLFGNNLSGTLDLSSFKNLRKVNLASNDLKSLIISDNNVITELDISGNENFGDFDFNILSNLTNLNCSLTNRKSLSINKLQNLKSLVFSGNRSLKEVDLSKCKKLKYLDCQLCSLKKLDLTPLTSLKYVDCSHNEIKEALRITSNKFKELHCSNNPLEIIYVLKEVVNSGFTFDINYTGKLDENHNYKGADIISIGTK